MIFVVGTGPGSLKYITLEAIDAIKNSDVIIGYKTYISLLGDLIDGKEVIENGMRQEVDRCNKALEISKAGKTVALISGGDSGVYGMAGLVLQLNSKLDEKQEIAVVQGVTSSVSAASVIGAPLMNDFCHISLSDLMVPWEMIEKRLALVSEADLVICLYNPRSKGRSEHLKKAFDIISNFKSNTTPVGIVKNAGRENEESFVMELKDIDFEICDMSTMVIIGNKETFIDDGKMITPRGYKI